MNVLVLGLSHRKLKYDLFHDSDKTPLFSGLAESVSMEHDRSGLCDCLGMIRRRALAALGGEALDAVAVLAPYGGESFRGPELVGPEVLSRLESLTVQAPLHVPSSAAIARGALELFPGTPVVFVFETSFFTSLPSREYSYALDSRTIKAMGLRRFGYHGLFHESACRLASDNRQKSGVDSPGRFLSICLEPRPEIAAVLGHLPQFVTGGATPLEGLPGETSCGEIDPSLVLTLAERMHWGPEQINDMLTRRSGLFGLTGRSVTLDETLRSEEENLSRAAELLRYRLLQACGAGMAALGGLDGIVFSGRYCRLDEILGPWLLSRIYLHDTAGGKFLRLERLEQQLERITADQAITVILRTRSSGLVGIAA